MYQSFEVTNFRCFSKLELKELERVNLIAGMNNVGKTAFLEAMFLHCGAHNPELTLRVNVFRGIEYVRTDVEQWVETPWASLFNQFDDSKRVELKGVELKGKNEPNVCRILRLKRPSHVPSEILTRATVNILGVGENITPSSTHVLELECEEKQIPKGGKTTKKGKTQKYHLILDAKGIRMTSPTPPPFPAIFLPARVRIPPVEDANRFGKLEVIGKQDVVLKTLQVVEPRLRRLAVVMVGNVPIIHGDIGLDRLVPLPLMGEGMARLTSLALAIANAPNGVVLLDEIENGLHYSVLPKVWRTIGEAARVFNTQIFATTHSFECIVAAHRAFSECEHYDFRLHRLERVNDSIRVVTYDQETIEAAIEMGMEVR